MRNAYTKIVLQTELDDQWFYQLTRDTRESRQLELREIYAQLRTNTRNNSNSLQQFWNKWKIGRNAKYPETLTFRDTVKLELEEPYFYFFEGVKNAGFLGSSHFTEKSRQTVSSFRRVLVIQVLWYFETTAALDYYFLFYDNEKPFGNAPTMEPGKHLKISDAKCFRLVDENHSRSVSFRTVLRCGFSTFYRIHLIGSNFDI